MYDVDYTRWAEYIESIFKRNNRKPSLLLDLGCGTGSFTIEMAKKGYDMIGVDISCEMLSHARDKSEKEGCEILYLNQDMSCLELYGTVDAAVCLMDGINHLVRKNDLKKLFKNLNKYLNPGGLFVFDINTVYKFERILGNNIFYEIDEDIAYLWRNTFNRKSRICEFDLTFFIRNGNTYNRYDETHYERAYSNDEIKDVAHSYGFKVLGIYHRLSFSSPKKNSDRVVFICMKK